MIYLSLGSFYGFIWFVFYIDQEYYDIQQNLFLRNIILIHIENYILILELPKRNLLSFYKIALKY